jgi:putative chitinase
MSFERFLAAVLTGDLITDLQQRAYVLATVKHECAGRWIPIEERYNGEKRSYFMKKYGGRLDLGNDTAEDGYTYRGRGYCQITGKANYSRLGRHLGVDLVSNPDRALEHDIAFRILTLGMAEGLFTGIKLSRFIPPKQAPNYFMARKVINSLDRAREIQDLAYQYEALLMTIREKA